MCLHYVPCTALSLRQPPVDHMNTNYTVPTHCTVPWPGRLWNMMNNDRSLDISFKEFMTGLQLADIDCDVTTYKKFFDFCDADGGGKVRAASGSFQLCPSPCVHAAPTCPTARP